MEMLLWKLTDGYMWRYTIRLTARRMLGSLIAGPLAFVFIYTVGITAGVSPDIVIGVGFLVIVVTVLVVRRMPGPPRRPSQVRPSARTVTHPLVRSR